MHRGRATVQDAYYSNPESSGCQDNPAGTVRAVPKRREEQFAKMSNVDHATRRVLEPLPVTAYPWKSRTASFLGSNALFRQLNGYSVSPVPTNAGIRIRPLLTSRVSAIPVRMSNPAPNLTCRSSDQFVRSTNTTGRPASRQVRVSLYVESFNLGHHLWASCCFGSEARLVSTDDERCLRKHRVPHSSTRLSSSTLWPAQLASGPRHTSLWTKAFRSTRSVGLGSLGS